MKSGTEEVRCACVVWGMVGSSILDVFMQWSWKGNGNKEGYQFHRLKYL